MQRWLIITVGVAVLATGSVRVRARADDAATTQPAIDELLPMTETVTPAVANAAPSTDIAPSPSVAPAAAASLSDSAAAANAPMSLPSAASQPSDDAPVVEPAPPPADAASTAPKQFMGLDTLSADVTMEGRLERRDVRTRYGGWLDRPFNQTNRRQLLQESIGLQSTGWFADPRTLTYDALFRGGLSQEQYDESVPGPDRHNDPNGEVLQYDLRLTALPAGKVSASAFASQLDDRIPRPFLPSLDRRRNLQRYGYEVYAVFHDNKLLQQQYAQRLH